MHSKISRNNYTQMVRLARSDYIKGNMSECKNDMINLHEIVNKLTGVKKR